MPVSPSLQSPGRHLDHAADGTRRKKSRCPGEKPVCSFCERLGQQCVYAPGEGELPAADIVCLTTYYLLVLYIYQPILLIPADGTNRR